MFSLDFSTRQPIYEQICAQVIRLSSLGVLRPDDKLPTVRVMASQLGVNPNTVAKAYQMLERDGYIYSAAGRGSFISSGLSQQNAQRLIAAENFTEAVRKAQTAGVRKEELDEIISQVYGLNGGEGNA